MEKEYQILSHLKEEEYTSQRKIAEKTKISVGMVNILLKRLVKKGLVKIERLNARSLRYILTPKGIATRTKLTYTYIKNSYSYIIRVTSIMEAIIRQVEEEGRGEIFLYGQTNEVYQIIKIALEKENVSYIRVKKESDLPASGNFTLVVWDLETEEKLGSHNPINIVKLV